MHTRDKTTRTCERLAPASRGTDAGFSPTRTFNATDDKQIVY